MKKIDSGRLAGVCTEVKHEKPASDATKHSAQNSSNKHAKAKPAKPQKPKPPSKLQKKGRPLKVIRSRELFRGTVYIDCDCYHRNGLQHDCPRSTCGGRSCKVKPWPECDLGTYFMNKWDKYYEHLDRIPPTSFCGPTRAWLEFLEQQEKKLKQQGQERKKESVKKIDKKQNTSRCTDITELAGEYVMIPVIEDTCCD
nr:PREDICTED: uncharacterized protein LOC105663011 [Megachile rotundata]